MDTTNTYHLPTLAVDRVIRLALEEDIGRGDLTTNACVPKDAICDASFVGRESLVFCGGSILAAVYAHLDTEVSVQAEVRDGTKLEPGQVAAHVRGPTSAVLSGERVALNLIQRLSGTATLTRQYVDALPEGSKTRITDTRKTTPGLRALQRYAVRCGGGYNHREDLSTAVLIKDNHVAAAGGIGPAIAMARAHAPHTCRIECEVDTLEQIAEALKAGADIIMLDNFSLESMKTALETIGGRAFVEVSGDVKPGDVTDIAALGVDAISVGALTHSARASNIGLDWRS
ncbi:MAG: carboxylating nicotinate-nucleotide diphosphorylase [Proteobacteria bacterium]|nr:carboxylating nicotinate-nucleotide diphosphorylase [Pseudomonadota bacterium]